LYDNSSPVPGQSLSFLNDSTTIGTNTTNATGWASIAWNTAGALGNYTVNVTYSANASLFTLASFNDSRTATVRANTSVPEVNLNSTAPTQGETVRFTARLLYDNGTPVADQTVEFRRNAALMGSNLTNATGWALLDFDTSSTPAGSYTVNATYGGNGSLSAAGSYNNSRTFTVSVPTAVNLLATILNSTNVTRDETGFAFNASLQNIGGDTANNTWRNWTLPANWTNASGNLTLFNATLAPNETLHNNLTVQVNLSAEVGLFLVVFNGSSTEDSDEKSVMIRVDARTSVSEVFLNRTSLLQGEFLRVTARLLYDNATALAGQTLEFRNNSSLLGANTTNATGWASFDWNTSDAPAADYSINVSFAGNGTLFVLDSSNNTTSVRVVNEKPSGSQPQINATPPVTVGTDLLHSVNWSDDTGLSGYIFSWNATGAACDGGFQNDSLVTFGGSPLQAWSNVSRNIPAACSGKTVGWRVYANDTANNTNAAPLQAYAVAASPNITAFAPATPVQESAQEARTFNITVDQVVNATWTLNGTAIQTNTSETSITYRNASAAVGTWNLSVTVTNANGTDLQTWIWTVYPRPVLSLGNVTNITVDWGRAFMLNHSVAVAANATASVLDVNYSALGFQNASFAAPVASGATVWANQTATLNSTGNTTVNVTARAAGATNDSRVFFANVTVRDLNASMLSPANQSAAVFENYTINTSAVDEYGEEFRGTAELLEEGVVIQNNTSVVRFANFSLNKSSPGAWNYSVRFTNASFYASATTNNTTVTVSKFFVTNIERHLVRIRNPVFIEILLSGPAVEFGTLNPGTVNASSQSPLTVNVTPNTNVKTNITINGTNLSGSPGVIARANIYVCNSSCPEANRTVLPEALGTPLYSDWVQIPVPGSQNQTRPIYFWLSVPPAQGADTYGGNVYVRATPAD
ncbi:MAG: Ig-like domain repeat protein, partial [Halobacteria archaeon]